MHLPCVYVLWRQLSEHRLRFLKIIRVSKIDFTGAQSKMKRNKWCSEGKKRMKVKRKVVKLGIHPSLASAV